MRHFCRLQTVLGQNMEISYDARDHSAVALRCTVHGDRDRGAVNEYFQGNLK